MLVKYSTSWLLRQLFNLPDFKQERQLNTAQYRQLHFTSTPPPPSLTSTHSSLIKIPASIIAPKFHFKEV